jgi:hypothetical protein
VPTDDYAFHDLLRVRVIHGGGPFMGVLPARYARYRAPASGEPDLVFHIGPFRPDRRGAYRLDGQYWIQEGRIGCEHRHKIARWSVEIEGWEGERTVVRIDPNLPGRVVMAGDSVPALIRFQLARKGALLIHGSAVERDGKALIFAGRSGAGKTITATRFVKAGYRYLGDDCAILSPSGVFGFVQPFNVRFTYDVEGVFGNPFTREERMAIAAKRLLSLGTAGGINLLTSLPPERIMGASLGESGACGHYVILQNGPEFRVEREYPLGDAVAQTLSNLRFECRELEGYLLAYAHVFPRSPLARFWDRQAGLLTESLRGSRIFRITVPRVYTDGVFDRLREALGAE